MRWRTSNKAGLAAKLAQIQQFAGPPYQYVFLSMIGLRLGTMAGSASHLSLAWLSESGGGHFWIFAVAVGTERFAYAFAQVVLINYISMLTAMELAASLVCVTFARKCSTRPGAPWIRFLIAAQSYMGVSSVPDQEISHRCQLSARGRVCALFLDCRDSQTPLFFT